jgi:hypothetical protein
MISRTLEHRNGFNVNFSALPGKLTFDTEPRFRP